MGTGKWKERAKAGGGGRQRARFCIFRSRAPALSQSPFPAHLFFFPARLFPTPRPRWRPTARRAQRARKAAPHATPPPPRSRRRRRRGWRPCTGGPALAAPQAPGGGSETRRGLVGVRPPPPPPSRPASGFALWTAPLRSTRKPRPELPRVRLRKCRPPRRRRWRRARVLAGEDPPPAPGADPSPASPFE